MSIEPHTSWRLHGVRHFWHRNSMVLLNSASSKVFAGQFLKAAPAVFC